MSDDGPRPDRYPDGRFRAGHQLVRTYPGSGYQPEMDEVARKLCLLGLTDAEVASFFAIDRTTLWRWRRDNPSLEDAMAAGRLVADAEVASSLYRRAVGVTVREDRVVRDAQGGQRVERLHRELPPDVSAGRTWLAARRRQVWGSDIVPSEDLPAVQKREIEAKEDAALEARIAELERRRSVVRGDDG